MPVQPHANASAAAAASFKSACEKEFLMHGVVPVGLPANRTELDF
jgi:hypothetical protein